ncbi:hypothetical protein BJX99DRAFT_225689 [Aspergillus californicus]
MGDIPSNKNMISTIITYPVPGQILAAHAPFTVKFQTANLIAGSVTNPNATLYSAPQAVKDGKVVGHVHVTIQSLVGVRGENGDSVAITPPNPAEFAFFQTVFGAGDENDGLSVSMPKGLPAGFYRACTMVATSNHQPVIMPVSASPPSQELIAPKLTVSTL